MSEDTVKRPGAMAVPGAGAFFPPEACKVLASTLMLVGDVSEYLSMSFTPEEQQVRLDLLAACETGAGA